MTMPGEAVSGDLLVLRRSSTHVLVAAIDGLGHGYAAAHAAQTAADCVETCGMSDVVSCLRRCHERLRDTRGVVLSVAVFDLDQQTLTWTGVGNVQGVLVRARAAAAARLEHLIQRPGVLGHALPGLNAFTVPVAPQDTVVLVTDGVGRDFIGLVRPGEPPQRIADAIIERHLRGGDDALVAVARYSFQGEEGRYDR